MKKIFFILCLIFSNFIFAHTLLVSVEDHPTQKGVIIIKGATDNGETTEGERLYILSDVAYDGNEEVFKEEGAEDYWGKLILYKTEFGEDETVVIPKPAIKRYIVLIYGGIGHFNQAKGIELKKDEIENWKIVLPEYVEKLNLDLNKFEKKKF